MPIFTYIYIIIHIQVARLAFHDPICLKAPAPGINAPAAFHEAKQGGGGDVGNTVDGFRNPAFTN